MRKFVTYGIVGVGVGVIALLLIPTAVLIAAIYGTWTLTDRLATVMERR